MAVLDTRDGLSNRFADNASSRASSDLPFFALGGDTTNNSLSATALPPDNVQALLRDAASKLQLSSEEKAWMDALGSRLGPHELAQALRSPNSLPQGLKNWLEQSANTLKERPEVRAWLKDTAIESQQEQVRVGDNTRNYDPDVQPVNRTLWYLLFLEGEKKRYHDDNNNRRPKLGQKPTEIVEPVVITTPLAAPVVVPAVVAAAVPSDVAGNSSVNDVAAPVAAEAPVSLNTTTETAVPAAVTENAVNVAAVDQQMGLAVARTATIVDVVAAKTEVLAASAGQRVVAEQPRPVVEVSQGAVNEAWINDINSGVFNPDLDLEIPEAAGASLVETRNLVAAESTLELAGAEPSLSVFDRSAGIMSGRTTGLTAGINDFDTRMFGGSRAPSISDSPGMTGNVAVLDRPPSIGGGGSTGSGRNSRPPSDSAGRHGGGLPDDFEDPRQIVRPNLQAQFEGPANVEAGKPDLGAQFRGSPDIHPASDVDLGIKRPAVVDLGGPKPGVVDLGTRPVVDLGGTKPGVVDLGTRPVVDLGGTKPGVVDLGTRPVVDLGGTKPGAVDLGGAKTTGIDLGGSRVAAVDLGNTRVVGPSTERVSYSGNRGARSFSEGRGGRAGDGLVEGTVQATGAFAAFGTVILASWSDRSWDDLRVSTNAAAQMILGPDGDVVSGITGGINGASSALFNSSGQTQADGAYFTATSAVDGNAGNQQIVVKTIEAMGGVAATEGAKSTSGAVTDGKLTAFPVPTPGGAKLPSFEVTSVPFIRKGEEADGDLARQNAGYRYINGRFQNAFQFNY